MQFTPHDIAAMLAAMGEPCTLTHRATRRPVTAIVDDLVEPANPLLGEGPLEQHSITVAAADAAGVNTDWFATVGSVTRQVLWVSPNNGGFVKIMLGVEQ